VCGPHIIIISVKDNQYRETGDAIGWERWTKAAIEKSADQIWGAERWLKTIESVHRKDGRIITLPPHPKRRYHRVAVALGSHGQVPLKWGYLGHGFVHVCDEYSVGALFSALDTITDFVDFLSASEAVVSGGVYPLFAGGGIEDLVALYLLQGRAADFGLSEHSKPNVLVLNNDLWQGFVGSKDFERIRDDLRESYFWDRLIDHFTQDLLTGGMFDMHSRQVTDNELALVTMALQPRVSRAAIAGAFIEFLKNEELGSAARMVQGHAGCAFVFTIGSSKDREFRMRELALRCLVVRGRLPGVDTVVGIATDRPGTSSVGYSSEIVYINLPNWTEQDEKDVQGIQSDLGYFKNLVATAET
jgi:hypothetical protein